MTAHTHDPATHTGCHAPLPARTGAIKAGAARPRWLVPGLLVVIVAVGLVVAGVLSVSAVVYAGLFGGMILMHVGGHGGHGSHGDGHASHGGQRSDLTDDADDLTRRSSVPQAPGSSSNSELDDRPSTDRQTDETYGDDQHNSHGCH